MRISGWVALTLLWAGLPGLSAEAQQLGVNCLPRPLCVTDPYGTPFHSWYGSPVAFNSYFYPTFNGGNYLGNVGVTNGFYGGGVPAVASATTPEWVVQRTSVFPIGTFVPWVASQQAISAPWVSSKDKEETTSDFPPRSSAANQPALQRDRQWNAMNVLAATEQSSNQHEGLSSALDVSKIRQISISWAPRDERNQDSHAEGDRLFREGQYGEAYLSYYNSQREVGDRCEVYFRQAYALVAMGRFSHAIAKLKRGLQVDPTYPRHGATLDEVFGVDGSTQKAEFIEQVTRWMKSNSRDPDRLFLLGVILYFDENPHSLELINSAWTLAGRGQHLRAFLECSTLPMMEPIKASKERVVGNSR